MGKQYNIFEDPINTDPGKRVTLWYRFNRGEWVYNHYDYKWLNNLFPKPKSREQEIWIGMKWKSKHRWLKNHKVYEYDRRNYHENPNDSWIC